MATAKNNLKISKKDRDMLRRLAIRQSEIADENCQETSENEWRRLNGLEPGRPLVWINDIPWQELNRDKELTLQAKNEFCREIEFRLRSTLYRWEHLRGDMVVEPVLYSPIVIQETTEPAADGPAAPCVGVDEDASRLNYDVMVKLFEGILPVESYGVGDQWFSMRAGETDPAPAGASMDKLLSASLTRLDQYVKLNILSLNNGNIPIGCSGPGFTDELPQQDFDPGTVTTRDQWGGADVPAGTVAEAVTPYLVKWLERFGLAMLDCSGHRNLDGELLRAIPNLRKIAVSSACDIEDTIGQIGDRYVLSYQCDPAVLEAPAWDPQRAREELQRTLEPACKNRGAVEVVLNNVRTVRYEPKRLWEWTDLAMEVVGELGG